MTQTMEERFDKKFSQGGGGTGLIQMLEDDYDARDKKIKSFIQEEITRAKAEVVREILKMKKDYTGDLFGWQINVEDVEAYAKQNNL